MRKAKNVSRHITWLVLSPALFLFAPAAALLVWIDHVIALYHDMQWWAALPPERWVKALEVWQPLKYRSLRHCLKCRLSELRFTRTEILWRIQTRQLGSRSGEIALVSRRKLAA